MSYACRKGGIVPSGSETPNNRELVSTGEVSVPVGLGTSLVSRRDDSVVVVVSYKLEKELQKEYYTEA